MASDTFTLPIQKSVGVIPFMVNDQDQKKRRKNNPKKTTTKLIIYLIHMGRQTNEPFFRVWFGRFKNRSRSFSSSLINISSPKFNEWKMTWFFLSSRAFNTEIEFNRSYLIKSNREEKNAIGIYSSLLNWMMIEFHFCWKADKKHVCLKWMIFNCCLFGGTVNWLELNIEIHTK